MRGGNAGRYLLTRFKSSTSVLPTPPLEDPEKSRLAKTTKSYPANAPSGSVRAASPRSRRIRFRWTASLDTDFGTTNANRGYGVSDAAPDTAMPSIVCLRNERATKAIRSCGSRNLEGIIPETVGVRPRQTVSFFRPTVRRFLRTRRPPAVFMRARNPCVRTRFFFFGW